MKTMIKACVVAIFLYAPVDLFAQKDSVWLECPLNEATVVPPPKNTIHYEDPDLCVVLVSIPDTTVKACYAGRVSNIEQTEDGKWDVVFYYKDYYFWYSGLDKLVVKKNDNLKAGQPVGYVATGQKIEMLLFKHETPLDPAKYLNCKGILKN